MTIFSPSLQSSRTLRPLHGFTLVELLVALVISLLGALAIMQIFVGSESGKRATGSLAEAQSGGLIALFAIERDMQQAGMGFTNLATLGCNVRTNLGSSFDNRPIQPVTIVPAGAAITHASNLWGIPPGDADSDMIAIAGGDGSAMVEGVLFSVAAAAGSTNYRFSSVLGINQNDYLLLGETGQECTLVRALTTNVSGDVTVDYGGAAGYSISGIVMHPGRSPQVVVYAVRNGTLTRCDFLLSNCSNVGLVNDTTVWVPVANDVVALVAQYGFDTSIPSDLTADVYCKSRVTAGGNCPNPDTGLTAPGNLSLAQGTRACDWSRIPVVQLALVSRSGQYEKDMVSPATLKLWPDSAVAPTTVGPDWNVSDQHYRYRVTRSAVALRNVIWMGAQSSC
jgi:type IV pilus assembly protein PilW